MQIIGPPLTAPPVRTLTEALDKLETRPGPWLTVVQGRDERSYDGHSLLVLARRWRAACRAAGMQPGDRIAIVMPNDEHFVAGFFGVLLAGATPVPLAWPGTLTPTPEAVAKLQPLVATADPRLVITIPSLSQTWAVPAVTVPADEPDSGDIAATPEQTAFLQLTSGSLGRPRGAVISHRAVVTCAWSMATGLDMSPADVGLSWLPLYHDMGLVGALLCPLLVGFPLHLMTPAEFLLHPERWLQRAAQVGATVAAAPDFGWRLVARRLRVDPGSLAQWRVGLNGAEPVHRSTLEAVGAKLGPYGLPSTTVRPSYGLAENTLGVCIYDPSRPASDLSQDGRAVPSVGRPLPGVQVQVRLPDGRLAASGEQGEICVRSGSLMDGYFRNPEATAAALVDGWLHTGDLGLIRDGQLHVTGRIKDLVIQNGVKFHPYDIERVAAEAAQAPPNGAAAFSVVSEGGEDLVVVVEVTGRRAEGVERRVRGALVEHLGIRVSQVIAVAPGALPRTTSGKVRRPAAAAMYGGGGAA